MMFRTVSVLAIAVLCASCRTDAASDLAQNRPLIDQPEYSAREDCLHREVARLIEPQGTAPNSLQEIAVSATNFCSEMIRAKLKGVSLSAAREDQVKTEQVAFAIGLELREKRPR
jgi:hypothetical protein